MNPLEGKNTIICTDIREWREWLEMNHKQIDSVWLTIYHKNSAVASVTYDEAVDEALCFGWIDSKPNKRNDESYYVFFAKRNPRSNWSRVNKNKISRLIREGRMAAPGLEMVELAKKSGTWNALDEVEKLMVPEGLQVEFEVYPNAFKNWKNFPPSVKRGILEWILNAKKQETRKKRIQEAARLAEQNVRANQYRPKNRK
jgi:uncharacterized protein YdeI (YjbR/CyaY-like superfamily)